MKSPYENREQATKYKAEVIYSDIEAVNQADFAEVKSQTHQRIQTTTREDSVLQILEKIIRAKSPADSREVPTAAHEYWSFRDELSVQEGVLYKDTRMIVPRSRRGEMLKKIH